jgi:hypothetical protein
MLSNYNVYKQSILSGIIPVVWSVAGRKWVCNDSRNTTIFGKISENNYMFRPLIRADSSYLVWFSVIFLFQPDDVPLN